MDIKTRVLKGKPNVFSKRKLIRVQCCNFTCIFITKIFTANFKLIVMFVIIFIIYCGILGKLVFSFLYSNNCLLQLNYRWPSLSCLWRHHLLTRKSGSYIFTIWLHNVLHTRRKFNLDSCRL